MKISKDEIQKIEEKIKEIESHTSGEIVPVILRQSDFYPAAHFRAALFAGILSALIFSYYKEGSYDPLWILWAQFSGMIIGYLSAYNSFFKRVFTKKAEIEEEVHQKALQVFFENDLHSTKDRTGILIMVSLLERKIEILADKGINEKVEKETWANFLKTFPKNAQKGQFVNAFIEVIENCGVVLSKNFPIQENDTNELSNKLILD